MLRPSPIVETSRMDVGGKWLSGKQELLNAHCNGARVEAGLAI